MIRIAEKSTHKLTKKKQPTDSSRRVMNANLFLEKISIFEFQRKENMAVSQPQMDLEYRDEASL